MLLFKSNQNIEYILLLKKLFKEMKLKEFKTLL
jgi:hypothetical protein